MRHTARRLTLFILAAFVLAAAPAARPAAVRAADLSSSDRALEGIWRLDRKRSDDPAKAMPRGGPEGLRHAVPGGPGGPGGMGGPPPGGGPGGRGGPPDREGVSEPDESDAMPGEERREDPMRRVLRPGAQMVIFVLSENVEVTEDEAPPITFALQDSLDAHGRIQELPGPVARWKKSALVTTFPLGRSGWLTETYEVSADGRTLTVRARATGGPQGAPPLDLKRIYERYEGE